MTVGGVFFLLSAILFVCLGMGLLPAPRLEMLAFACLALGLLLHGIPVPWRGP